ncbi:unnamed protein product [Meganyctiphanes norvegica]|uniref:VWFC domain-containing protein n=1 Tax=Meganyctiphanes norvegica TaxID=48144 RepID=A0AAV2S4C1_MEGNR
MNTLWLHLLLGALFYAHAKAQGHSRSSVQEPVLPTSLSTTTSSPFFATKSNECEGVKCIWKLWVHYETKGCTPEYTNGSCCPTHFKCPRPEDLSPDKCYLFGKAYNLGDGIQYGEDETCGWPDCNCYDFGRSPQFECPQDVGLCWNRKLPSPGCWHKSNPCGGCPDEVCDDSIPHICSWNNKTYEEGQYMSFDGEHACQYCRCNKNFTGPTGEGCSRSKCGMFSGIDVRSDCASVYRDDECCPSESLCDNDPNIQAVPTSSRESGDGGLTCTLGKFTRSVGERLENDDCRINCTCLTPPEFTCVQTNTCLTEKESTTELGPLAP